MTYRRTRDYPLRSRWVPRDPIGDEGQGGRSRYRASSSGATGAGATGTASLTGIVTSASVSHAGSNYIAPPSVTIGSPTIPTSDSNASASAQAVMQVQSVSVTAAGSNYTTSASAVIAPPNDAGSAAVAGTVSVTSGSITGIAVTTGGFLYDSPPSVTISDPSGAGASAVGLLSVLAIQITNVGYNYATSPTAGPTVSFSAVSGSGGGASASALVQGIVTGVAMGATGSNYAMPPAVSVTSSAGTPAPVSSATFQAIIAADGGTAIFPMPSASGAWRRILD